MNTHGHILLPRGTLRVSQGHMCENCTLEGRLRRQGVPNPFAGCRERCTAGKGMTVSLPATGCSELSGLGVQPLQFSFGQRGQTHGQNRVLTLGPPPVREMSQQSVPLPKVCATRRADADISDNQRHLIPSLVLDPLML